MSTDWNYRGPPIILLWSSLTSRSYAIDPWVRLCLAVLGLAIIISRRMRCGQRRKGEGEIHHDGGARPGVGQASAAVMRGKILLRARHSGSHLAAVFAFICIVVQAHSWRIFTAQSAN
ncbi:hypothetical protein K438DRAFT_1970357 [Mycena galopus ATCC 62051]|nr:hypothetical protein K438DRAFT_1970357 [Mycena galopus ATCC 62051]